jgi:hypothetical protein
MDLTLREYLKLSDDYHELIDKNGIAMKNEQLEEKIHNLQIGIKNIQAISKRMADVSNIINRILLNKNKKRNDKTYIDTYPYEQDHAVMRFKYPEEKKEIANNIDLPVKIVEKECEIPISKLYYVKEYDQYAINIEGLIIRGNLSNIVEYQTEKSARCEYGIECKSFKKNIPCKYYHDPDDYIKLNIPIPKDNIRNYTVGSWLYSRNKRPKTYFTRHIGSGDTILYDLVKLRKMQYKEEIDNREGQLIHDLLIYLILHNKGLLERYTHWK